eukprot:m.177733 g.177733  ORF g.177733 m.177733 type:complete len:267 (+) comp53378_c0_seq4:286-1086(+)
MHGSDHYCTPSLGRSRAKPADAFQFNAENEDRSSKPAPTKRSRAHPADSVFTFDAAQESKAKQTDALPDLPSFPKSNKISDAKRRKLSDDDQLSSEPRCSQHSQNLQPFGLSSFPGSQRATPATSPAVSRTSTSDLTRKLNVTEQARLNFSVAIDTSSPLTTSSALRPLPRGMAPAVSPITLANISAVTVADSDTSLVKDLDQSLPPKRPTLTRANKPRKPDPKPTPVLTKKASATSKASTLTPTGLFLFFLSAMKSDEGSSTSCC